MYSHRNHMNKHLQDAELLLQEAATSNQGRREALLREAREAIEFVLKEERDEA